VVTDQGIAVNPIRRDLLSNLAGSGVPLMDIEELHKLALKITGAVETVPVEGDIVGLVEYRDGTIIDVIRKLD
jgi:citrate lyase subunit alpha/citrate CoA-transferase